MYKIGDESAFGWTAQKEKLGCPFPNLPYWKDGNVFHSETLVILRSIATKYKHEYLGRNFGEQGNVDAYMTSIEESAMKWFEQFMFADDWASKKETGMAAAQDLLQTYATCIGDKKFLCGSQPSIADFLLHWVIKMFSYYDPRLFSWFPKISEFRDTMECLPGVRDANKAQAHLLPFATSTGWQRDNMQNMIQHQDVGVHQEKQHVNYLEKLHELEKQLEQTQIIKKH